MSQDTSPARDMCVFMCIFQRLLVALCLIGSVQVFQSMVYSVFPSNIVLEESVDVILSFLAGINVCICSVTALIKVYLHVHVSRVHVCTFHSL